MVGQRVMINLEFSELIERLKKEAKERQVEFLRKGNEIAPVPADLQIAQLSGTSARNKPRLLIDHQLGYAQSAYRLMKVLGA